jgi:uncharacterized protein (UPF0335 family)
MEDGMKDLLASGTITGPDGIERPATDENIKAAAEQAIRGARAKVKDTDADRQVVERAYHVAADELRQFVERWERLDDERKDVVDQQKEVMAEAKGRGYDTKALRHVINLRKTDRDDQAEFEAVCEMYRAALGM